MTFKSMWWRLRAKEYTTVFLESDYLVTRWLSGKYSYLFSDAWSTFRSTRRPIVNQIENCCNKITENHYGFKKACTPEALIVGWRFRKILHDQGLSKLFSGIVSELKDYWRVPAIFLCDRDGFYTAMNDIEAEPFDLIMNTAGVWRNRKMQNYRTWERYHESPDIAVAQKSIEPLYFMSEANLKKIQPSFIFTCDWCNKANVKYAKETLSKLSFKSYQDKVSKKNWDISFRGSLNNIKRFEVVLELKKRLDKRFVAKISVHEGYINGLGHNFLSKDDSSKKFHYFSSLLRNVGALELDQDIGIENYIEWHKDSKISLSIPGHDPLSARIFHGFMYGSLVLMERMDRYETTYPFIDRQNVVMYDHGDWDSLEQIINDICKNKINWVQIAYKGHKLFLEWLINHEIMVEELLVRKISSLKQF